MAYSNKKAWGGEIFWWNSIQLYILLAATPLEPLRRRVGKGLLNLPHFQFLVKKRKSKKIIWWGVIFLRWFILGRVVVPTPNIDKNLPRHMRSYTVKENHIGSVDPVVYTERHVHKHRHPVTFIIECSFESLFMSLFIII